MRITKFAHSCLLIEEGNARIVTDPGNWNETPAVDSIDAILITHEHQDHFNIAQVKELLTRSPGAVVITHAAVGALLTEAKVPFTLIEEGTKVELKGVLIESFGHEHAVVYGSSPCRNTGFLIAERLFVPGDALHDVPGKSVEILALPTGGPWMKFAEAIDYAKRLSPRVVFPIHDAMYIDDYKHGFVPMYVGGRLSESGIEFRDMADGATEEF
jgi:L-ascorbate metabolism protein UlaG (beta-lactamase superfamily)